MQRYKKFKKMYESYLEFVKNHTKIAFFNEKICVCQKKAVPLQPLLKIRSILKEKAPGPLAQLNRVPHYGCGGCRFESCMDHKRTTAGPSFLYVTGVCAAILHAPLIDSRARLSSLLSLSFSS